MHRSRELHTRKPFRLLALGGATLVDSGGAVVAEQRRRLALLVLVAAGRTNGVSRDKLVAYLSPESSTESARHALHQLVYYLRQQAGDDVFLGTDALRLNPDVVTSDVAEFQDAMDRGDLDAAVTLYRGPFLDGFHISDSAEFDTWAANVRSHLAALNADAQFRLATAADDRGDHEGAIVRWTRIVSDDPLGARGAAGLIRAYATAGDKNAALRYAARYESLVKAEFGTALDPELAAYVSELHANVRAGGAAREHAAPVQERASGQPQSPRSVRPRLLRAATFVVLTTAIVAGAYGLTENDATELTRPDGGLVVMPFRVTAPDSSTVWLREGLVELLTIRLSDARPAGPVDARSAIAAWSAAGGRAQTDLPRPAMLAAARRIRATQAVIGSVASSSGELLLTAELVDLETTRVLARVEARGRADSIMRLVDTVAVRLVSIQGGEDMLRAGVLGATSVAAVRAYLDGRAALRRGDWNTALGDFDRAIALDSTFASAALGLREASGYLDGGRVSYAESLALRHQHRLSPRERATLVAELGPNYPAYYPAADQLRAWRAVVSKDFFNADAWMRLGLVYYHHGAQLDVPNAMTEARIALERAMEFDSTRGVPSRLQLVAIAAVSGDSALIRRVLTDEVIAPADTAARVYRSWLRAFARRDTVALAAARPRLDQMRSADLSSVWNFTQRAGFDLEDARRAETIFAGRARSSSDQSAAAPMRYHGALTRGRPKEAQAAASLLMPEWRPLSRVALQVLAALYGDADRASMSSAVGELAQEVTRPLATDAAELRSQMIHVCVSAQWSLAHGDTRTIDDALAKLRTPEPGANGGIVSFYETCALAIEAWRAVVEGRPNARVLMGRLDSLMLTGPAYHWALPDYRIAARLWDSTGEPARALAAIRRRRMDVHLYLAPDLREEGRLALRAADTTAAVTAWHQYLTIRSDPEPSLRGEVDSVRRQVVALEAQRGPPR